VGLLSLALIIFTAAPLLRSDAWWIRIFDFPRLQIAALLGLTLLSYAALRYFGRFRTWEYALAAIVGFALVWQLIFIAPYTVFYPKQMSVSRAEDDSNRISLLIYNALHDNREVAVLRDLIHDNDPDIGSDHFPMLVILDYNPGASVDEEPKPDAGDEQEADEAIDKGESID
jgi:endonuclease/exonuclease/phosphatase (EEP) superfamily protein YafD